MDAYTDYIIRLSQARTTELRREAAEFTLSDASRRDGTSSFTRAAFWLGQRLRASFRSATPSEASFALQSAPSRPAP